MLLAISRHIPSIFLAFAPAVGICLLFSAAQAQECNNKLPLCAEECRVTVFPPPLGRVPHQVVPTHQVYGPGTTLYKCGERLVYRGRSWCTGDPTHRFDEMIQGCRNEPLQKPKDPTSQ